MLVHVLQQIKEQKKNKVAIYLPIQRPAEVDTEPRDFNFESRKVQELIEKVEVVDMVRPKCVVLKIRRLSEIRPPLGRRHRECPFLVVNGSVSAVVVSGREQEGSVF